MAGAQVKGGSEGTSLRQDYGLAGSSPYRA